MTIHAAKGLEFGVVCVADLGRRGMARRRRDLLVGDGEVGLRLVGIDGSSEKALAFERLRDLRGGAPRAEEERIMYVALTRARERLILSGAVPVGPWPGAGPAAPPLNWLGPALLGGDTAAAPAQRGGGWRDVEWSSTASPRACGARLNRPGHDRPGSARSVARPCAARALAPRAARPGPVRLRLAGARCPAARRAHAVVLRAVGLAALRLPLLPAAVLGLPEEGSTCRTPSPRTGPGDQPRPAWKRGCAAPSSTRCWRSRISPPPGGPGAPAVAAAGERFGVVLSEDGRPDIAGLVEAFAHSPLRARLAAPPPCGARSGFAFALGDALVTGVVDVMADEAGGRLVVDYKSDGVDDAADLEALVEEDYGMQRRIYALAALRGGAERVEVVHAVPRASRRAGHGDVRRRRCRDAWRPSCSRWPPVRWPATTRSAERPTASCARRAPGAGPCAPTPRS